MELHFATRPAWFLGFVCLSLARPALGQPTDQIPLLFRQDFRGKSIDVDFLDIIGDTTIDTEAGGVIIRLPDAIGSTAPTGFKTAFPFEGDFEVTGSFEFVRLDTPGKGAQAGISLSVRTDNPGAEAAKFSLFNRPDGLAYRCTKITTDEDGNKKYAIKAAPAKAHAGQLRLARRGDRVSFLLKEENAEDFREVHQIALPPDGPAWAQLGAETSDGITPVVVRVIDFEVRSKSALKKDLSRLQPIGRQGAANDRTTFWVVLLTGAFLIAAVGVGLRRFARKAGNSR
jgi:hypothetical protein